jgi:hypothetical protein
MRCPEKNPADRWQSANDLLAQLDAMSTPGGSVFPSSRASARDWVTEVSLLEITTLYPSMAGGPGGGPT